MNKDLQFYVNVIQNVFSIDECNQFITELDQSNHWEKHSFFDNRTETITSYDDDLDIVRQGIPSSQFMMDRLWNVIHLYITNLKFEWFQGWSGFTPVKFNRYQPGMTMHTHCDHIQTIFDGTKKGIPSLSVVGLLNNDYKGGEFIMFEDIEIKINPGDVLVFPSNFLYPHRVNHVTEGTRYSYVSWVW